jgi:hypothetical protein
VDSRASGRLALGPCSSIHRWRPGESGQPPLTCRSAVWASVHVYGHLIRYSLQMQPHFKKQSLHGMANHRRMAVSTEPKRVHVLRSGL